MYSLDQATVKRWIAVEDRWFPGAISTTCPTCASWVIFTTGDHAYDAVRDTIASTATCPSCDETVSIWGIRPASAGATGQKGCARVVMYPEPPQRNPIAGANLLPERVRATYLDTLKTYNFGIWRGTTVFSRVTLEGVVANLLGETKGNETLAAQIKRLSTTVDLAEPLITLANAVRGGGNIGAHFDFEKEANQETAAAILDLIEYWLEYVYTLPAMVRTLEQRIKTLGQPAQPTLNQDKGTGWNEKTFFAALAESCTPAGLQAARRLYDFAKARGAQFLWNPGEWAAVTARLPVQGTLLSVFSIYQYPKGRPAASVNFEYLRAGVPKAVLAHLAERLAPLIGGAARLAELENADYKKRPPMIVDDVLAQPGAVETIEQAIEELLLAKAEP